MKRCTKCKIEKPLNEFCKHKITKDGFRHDCKECNKKYGKTKGCKQIQKRHKQTHKTEIAKYQKKYRQTGYGKLKYESPERSLKTRYGITLKQYDKIFEDQGGVCAICGGVNKSGRRLHLDHDHKTGKIRGLLCSNCNTGIGMLKENINILCSAISYLGK